MSFPCDKDKIQYLIYMAITTICRKVTETMKRLRKHHNISIGWYAYGILSYVNLKIKQGVFPDGPAVKNLPFGAADSGSIRESGN